MSTEVSRNRNIIVTGGAGYIGSHACKALAGAGYQPVTYDNLTRGHASAVKWGPLEVGDILDADRLDEVFRLYRPCAVMHFAALAYVGESVNEPVKYYQNNVVGTFTLLNRMMQHAVRNFIFSSSCAIYGIPDRSPITEAHAQNPINPYGKTKAIVEQMLADFSATGDLRYVSLRYFNAAGADPEGDLGEDHEPETHLLPLILQAAAGKRSHIDIYGDDYDTPDGTCVRDYIHVTDLIDAHIRSLGYLLEGGHSEFYNLGTEQGYSVREIIEHARQVTGRQIKFKIAPRRPGDPPNLVADASKIRQGLGWAVPNSNIDTILSNAWKWYNSSRI